jgi:hypothetical protein
VTEAGQVVTAEMCQAVCREEASEAVVDLESTFTLLQKMLLVLDGCDEFRGVTSATLTAVGVDKKTI